MEKPVYYIDCILPVPLNQYFTYRISEKIADKAKVGCRVIVQFGNRKYYTAIILQIHTNKPEYETKETETLLDDEPIVGLHSFSFWEWMAAYYCCPVGDVMNAALPSGLKLESTPRYILTRIGLSTNAFRALKSRFFCSCKVRNMLPYSKSTH